MHGLKVSIQLLRQNSCSSLRALSTSAIGENAVVAQLKARSVIRFSGPDTIKFLQGLLTNDVTTLDKPKTAPENATTPNMPALVSPAVYAAFLTPQGRFLYDFFLYRQPRSDEKLDRTGSGPGPDPGELEVYADVDGSVVDELLATLKKYRLRSKVDIENLAEDFLCWQRFGGDRGKNVSYLEEPESGSLGWGGAVDLSGLSSSRGNNVGWHWNKDPRLACLGYRGIFPSNETPPLVESDKETNEGNYLLWRLEKGVAEGSVEIPKGEAIPLEYNLAGLHAISFDKGCYIGQELIARTHHRGVIRKRLIPLRFLNDNGEEFNQKVPPGSDIIETSTQKKAGTVTTALGPRGLGLLRLDGAFKGMGSLTIKGHEDVRVETIRPKWWPEEWFRDHQQQIVAD